ncbi:MAG: hypothetical protein Kow0077_16760 [Anaerolineae bacterium]
MGYILLVEDDKLSRQLLKDLLATQGYEVREANDGMEALQHAQAEKPALILMDVMMPRVSGLDVAKQIIDYYRDNPPYLIFISALGSVQDIEQGKLAGASDYIVKPFSPDALLAKIKKAMTDRG